ncbi:MAG: mechanosensitive ion channel domain-containing protein [Rhodomicrobium sp.]
MILRYWTRALAALAIVTLMHGGAVAQSPAPKAAQPAQPADAAPAPAQPAKPFAPQIDKAAIHKLANESVGKDIDIDAKLKGWQTSLDKVDEALRKPKHTYATLDGLRDDLLKLRDEGDEFKAKLEPPLNAIADQVQKLPPVPTPDQPPESEQAAQLRAELNYHLGLLTSARSALDATRFRIEQQLSTIQDIRRKVFTSSLFKPAPGVYAAKTYVNVRDYAGLAAGRFGIVVQDWWNDVRDQQQQLMYLTAVAAALALALGVLAWRGVPKLRAWPDADEPPFWKRASTAAGVILLRSAPLVAPAVFLFNAADQVEPFPDHVDRLFYALGRSLTIIAVVQALMTTVLAPGAPRWRLLPMSDWAASRISALVLALVLVYGVTTFLYAVTRIVQAPLSLTLALAVPSNIIVAALLAAILKTPLKNGRVDGMPTLEWLGFLRAPMWIVAIGIVVTTLSGYIALSRFIAQQLIVTGSILALIYLLLLWVDGFAQSMSEETTRVGARLNNLSFDRDRRERLSVPVSLFLKLMVLIASVPFILNQWGYPWPDIVELYRQLFFGFRIGNTQISLAAILASIIVFILGYFAAKLFQGWLDAQVLKPAGLSGGLRDSIRTTVGYAGVFAAALIALSYAGFPLSNLAIVAGAFSVGIGFGLQSVVSNFVSGLILLAERPIKVGDLVTVGGEEGYVRKISVRSTEIETFDRSSVLVPNSSFITDKVKNWTLRNNIVRLKIAVGVAYGADPRQVKAILLKVAQDNLNVMTSPEPFVDFEEFGADAMNFKLYAYIGDLNKSMGTRTDLRIAILEAFHAAGIVMPAQLIPPQLLDAEWLRETVRQYIANQGPGHAPGNGSQEPAVADHKS